MQEPILIISDIHLTPIFHKKRFALLQRLFEEANTIILNGDFFDNYFSYQWTVRSRWAPLFEILKEKHVIYLFGNHDPDSPKLRKVASPFVNQFQKKFSFSYWEKEFLVLHGDAIVSCDTKLCHKWGKYPVIREFLDFMWRMSYGFLRMFSFLSHKFPKSLGYFYLRLVKRQNKLMKEFARRELKENHVLVCGHTHVQEMDIQNRFINTGANCCFPRVEYLLLKGREIIFRE